MKFKKLLLVGVILLAILTIGAVSASENVTDSDALNAVDDNAVDSADSSDVLSDGSYYDGDFYIYVDENYTHGKCDWNSYELVYIASYSQRNFTVEVFVDDVEKQSINVTDGHFSVGIDENGTGYGIYYKNVYPNDLGLDYGSHNLKVNVDGKTCIDTPISINEKEDFTIWLQNPYYCEQEYWQTPSFLIIDSNNLNNGTLEVYVNGSRKLSYVVVNGLFEQIENCSNKSRYAAPSVLFDGYGNYGIQIKFTENGMTKTLKDENVTVGEFAPTTNPQLDVCFDFYTLVIPADNIAHIYLPHEATGNLTISYNNVHNQTVNYSKGYGEHYIHNWDLNHLGENLITLTYVGDDFGTLTATGTVLVLPKIDCPDYVNVGDEFNISILTHGWVNGNFSVYEYDDGVKGKLLASSDINAYSGGNFAVASLAISCEKSGLNYLYLDYNDYYAGHYPIIQEVYAIQNSENVTVNVPKEVENGSSFNLTVNAQNIDFTFAQISVDGGESEFVMFENGVASKSISNLTVGYHTVKVFYENQYFSNGGWLREVYLDTFTVNVGVKTQLDASYVEMDYNSTGYLYAILKDDAGNFMTGKDLKININNESWAEKTNDYGQAKFAIRNLPGGNFTALISFEGFEGYMSSNTTSKVTVNRLETAFTSFNFVLDPENKSSIQLALTDLNLNPLSGKAVVIQLSGETYYGTTDDNGVVAAFFYLSEGNHTGEAVFAGDDCYKQSHTPLNYTFSKVKTQLSSEDVNMVVASPGNLAATLKDANGEALSLRAIVIGLNGKIYNETTDGNGNVNLGIELDAGNYTAHISFAGDYIYQSSNTTSKVTVNKSATELTAPQISTVYNVGKDLIITLKSADGQLLAGKSVIVTLNKKHYNKTTDSNGRIMISSYNLAPKTYVANIKFEGDNNYWGSGIDSKVVVSKANPKITASNKEYKVKAKTKKYTITLKNNRNAVMKYKKVTLKVNKKTYTAKTNSKGKATFKITKLTKKGTFKAVIKYAGDSCYKPVSKTVKITVKK